ncbi:MAG: hypothetical protein IIV87_05860 [Oscillospiraceae bacterium]|nr:hypothetical protein [Oscillospiraceae bacterium]
MGEMNAWLTDFKGKRTQLPRLLQWEIRRTDGDPCDGFSVLFVFDAAWSELLPQMVRFDAEEGAKTVFAGVVDDYEIRFGCDGLLCEVTGRGMAAKLMDNEVRAAEYASAQLEDILRTYVRPYGISRIEADKMGQVHQFAVETGDTCWQVLCGFCRHSANIYPRFLADGTLVLKQQTPQSHITILENQVLEACFTENRYGVASKQIQVNTRNGSQVTAENAAFIARGGASVRVNGRTGTKIRAVWRTAQQRLEDSMRESALLKVRVAGAFVAEPLDAVTLRLQRLGITGTFTVQSVQTVCDEHGLSCTLILR